MPDGQDLGADHVSNHERQKKHGPPSSDLGSALADAKMLLDHAASNGLLPVSVTSPETRDTLVADLVHAYHGERQGLLTPDSVIAFWNAYGRLSRLVKPVTAASLRASNQISLLGMKSGAGLMVLAVIVFSIFLFMSNSTATDTSEVIEQQNIAALRLWSDLQMLRASVPEAGATSGAADRTLLTERTFEELVEFSRKNSWLLQSASRLNNWFLPPWLQISPNLVRFEPGQPIDHLNVPPQVSTWQQIDREGTLQIEAYQHIRDFGYSLYKMESLLYGSISTYFLPTVYAVLGAFLYGFRLYSRLIRRKQYLRSVAHSARFFIAAIAGLVVGLFGSLLPTTVPLPPLAIAFLVGYAVEAFFSRLDAAIAKLKGNTSASDTAPLKADGATPGQEPSFT